MNQVKYFELEEKRTLNEEWLKLKSLTEKLEFWNTKLPVNYIIYMEALKDFSDLDWFKFDVTQSDFKKMNIWILDNYLKLSDNPQKNKQFLNAESLIKDFNEKNNSKEDSNYLVKEEIRRIDRSFVTRTTRGGGLLGGIALSSKMNLTYNASFESYSDYLEYDIFPDYKYIHPHVGNTLSHENGLTLAKYKKYLLSLLNLNVKEKPVPEKEEQSDKYNVRIQHQILHFLGTLEKVNKISTVEKKGAFLSALLNRNPQRARKPFSSKSILYSKDKAEARNIKRDLEKVHDLFEKAGFKTELKEVASAIKKINTEHFPDQL